MGQESEKKHRKIYLLLIMLLLVAGILLGILYFQSSQEIEKSQKEEKVRDYLKRYQLDGLDNRYPAQLSGGQKQRVAIVRALCMHPEILLFDEVTAALDPEMVREVLDVMLDLAKQGRTMLIVTHEMQFARAIADRIIFLDNGKIVEEATPDEFFDNPKTERAKQFLNTFEFDSVRAKKELAE